MKKCIFTLVALMLLCGSGAFAKKDKNKDSYNYQRGLECFNESNYSEAYDWFSKELDEHPDNPYAYMYLGVVYYQNDQYSDALSALEKALKKLPKKDKEARAAALIGRSAVHLSIQDTVAALADYTEAISATPADPDIYERRGEIYYFQGKYDLSDADYNKMKEIDSTSGGAYMGLGRNAAARKEWDDAIG